MKINLFHPYHLVDASPWPLFCASSTLLSVVGLVKWFHFSEMNLLLLGLLGLSITSAQWWRDVSREGTFQGKHTSFVEKGLQSGMILFILSEVMFFFSFFWAFFHSSLSPTLELGYLWPPLGLEALDPMTVPLLNTVILLSSGVSVTWAHMSLLEKKNKQAKQSLIITILLGFYFTRIQAWEYMDTSFSLADSVFGAVFFIATGFHGLHVLIGATFLSICLLRILAAQLSASHHFGFEAAAWYWHFVDVVWLFLFTFIYWWGS